MIEMLKMKLKYRMTRLKKRKVRMEDRRLASRKMRMEAMKESEIIENTARISPMYVRDSGSDRLDSRMR